MGAPAGAHVLPGAGRRSPAGACGAAAAAPPGPGRGTGLLPARGRGTRAGPPALWLLSIACVRLVAGRAPQRKFAGNSRALGQEGKVWGARRRSPGPAPRTAPAYVGEAPRPGRAVSAHGSRRHPRGLVSVPGLAPYPLPPPAARRPRAAARGGSAAVGAGPAAATSESARAGEERAPGACQVALGVGRQPQRSPLLAAWGSCWMWGENLEPPESRGQWRSFARGGAGVCRGSPPGSGLDSALEAVANDLGSFGRWARWELGGAPKFGGVQEVAWAAWSRRDTLSGLLQTSPGKQPAALCPPVRPARPRSG